MKVMINIIHFKLCMFEVIVNFYTYTILGIFFITLLFAL